MHYALYKYVRGNLESSYMEIATWGFIGTIVGAIVGASASILTTLINSNKAIKLQTKADKLKREEQAREFQRENLLKLQEAISVALRNCSRIYFEDLENLKKGQKWSQSLVGQELSEETRISQRELLILTERVANDALRKSLSGVRSQMAKVQLAGSKREADLEMQKLTMESNELMTEIGRVLRNYFEKID